MRLQIVNETRGAVLATDARRATNPLARLLGLMGRKRLPEGEALILDGVKGIHTLFMRFPIDVLFLDRAGIVLLAIEGLRPWRFSPYRRNASAVIELPEGALYRSGTRTADRLRLI